MGAGDAVASPFEIYVYCTPIIEQRKEKKKKAAHITCSWTTNGIGLSQTSPDLSCVRCDIGCGGVDFF